MNKWCKLYLYLVLCHSFNYQPALTFVTPLTHFLTSLPGMTAMNTSCNRCDHTSISLQSFMDRTSFFQIFRRKKSIFLTCVFLMCVVVTWEMWEIDPREKKVFYSIFRETQWNALQRHAPQLLWLCVACLGVYIQRNSVICTSKAVAPGGVFTMPWSWKNI